VRKANADGQKRV